MQTTIDKHESGDPVEWGPLVLHLRRLRHQYREQGLTQAQLARIAGISPRLLRSYESCRDLPSQIETILRLSLALETPVEWLIAPEFLERLKAEVERRRARPGGDAGQRTLGFEVRPSP